MLPIIIGGAAALIATAGIVYRALYTGPQPEKLGRFVVWGQPNAGKTTFIHRIRGESYPQGEKVATTAKRTFRHVPLQMIDGQAFQIEEIVDMPGTRDRMEDWLDLVRDTRRQHIFYLIDISRNERDYLAAVRSALKKTADALKDHKTVGVKRLSIIASHVDMSAFKTVDPSEVNNQLQEDDEFRKIYESFDGIRAYVYAANLTDDDHFQRLIQSIVRDART